MQKYKVGDRLTLACGVEIVEITATSQLYELKKVNRDNTLSVRTIGVLDYELDELIAPEPLCCEMLTEATE